MVNHIFSFSNYGNESHLIDIEVDIKVKAMDFSIVGMAGPEVKESAKRIENAIQNSGYHFPGKRITVNLAPAGIKKIGTYFDLAIALGILNDKYDFQDIGEYIIIGELSLDGTLRPVSGGLAIAAGAEQAGFKKIIVPAENAAEMSLVRQVSIYGIKNITEAVEFLTGGTEIPRTAPTKISEYHKDTEHSIPDIIDIRGQNNAKRALLISAAGHHNISLIGPPGTGKTMLAKRLPGIMPRLSEKEAIETTMIYSLAGKTDKEKPVITERPFRAPHHTASDVSIIGGGRIPKPGEVSLAHNGILFLDELQLYPSNVLQVLREPLENHQVQLSRAEGSMTYPADFLFISAFNPSKSRADIHQTGSDELKKLIQKLSGPLIDRIDMHIQVSNIRYEEMKSKPSGHSSGTYRQTVLETRKIQSKRFRQTSIETNSKMNHQMIEQFCPLTDSAALLLKTAMNKFQLSIRSYDRILKISRTIADLERVNIIDDIHISEALQYRFLDRYLQLIN